MAATKRSGAKRGAGPDSLSALAARKQVVLPPYIESGLLSAISEALKLLPAPPLSLGLALSGGADSAMLAVHAQYLARQRGIHLHFFHIHHGLQASADWWQTHVHDLARLLDVPCHSARVQVALGKGSGMEAAAREARYRGLAQLARQAGVQSVLLAHHLDDQAETVLLQLLRGAGPAGMAAMAPLSQRDGVSYLRPWLGVPRKDILRLATLFGRHRGWFPVSDPTNVADRYTRGAVRERLVPQLDERWPAWRRTLARHARVNQELVTVLDEVAAQDFERLEADNKQQSFSLARWRELSPARQGLVLRYWLGLHGLPMPTEARLAEWMRQMRGLHALGHDRKMRLPHAGIDIICVRGRVMMQEQLPA